MSESMGSNSGAQHSAPVLNFAAIFNRHEDQAGNGSGNANAQPNAPNQSEPPFANNRHVPKAKHNTLTAMIPPENLPNNIHPSRTYRLRLSGPDAARVTPQDICVALVSDGTITLDEWENQSLYYKMENPFERYITLLPSATFDLHHNTSTSFKPASLGNSCSMVELRVEDLDSKDITIFLEWVPVTYSDKTVEKMLTLIGLHPTSLRRDTRSCDKWIISLNDDPRDVPHYIDVRRFAFDGNTDGGTKVLVNLPRRWTECEHCRSVHHRSHKCPNKSKRLHNTQLISQPQQRRNKKPNAPSDPMSDNDGFVKPKPKRQARKKTKPAYTARPSIPTQNRFDFQYAEDQTDTETGGEEEDWQSTIGTPVRPDPNSQADIFGTPQSGVQTREKPTQSRLRNRKTPSQSNKPATSKKGPKKGEASWADVGATPSRSLRARTPRSAPPDPTHVNRKRKPEDSDDGSTQETDPPCENRVKDINKNVSGIASREAATDGPVPASIVPDGLDLIPSSMPEADALLGAVGGAPPPPPPGGTVGVGTDSQAAIRDAPLNECNIDTEDNVHSNVSVTNDISF